MRSLYISIIITVVTAAGLGLFFFNLWQADSRDTLPQDLKVLPWKERVIQNLTETITSSNTYDDKLDAIQKTVSQTNNEEFSHILLTNLKSDYADGEKVKFNLTVFVSQKKIQCTGLASC